MHEDLIRRLRTTKVTVYKAEDVNLLQGAANAIEELNMIAENSERSAEKFLHNISELETEIELLKREVKRGHFTLQYDGDGLWHCSECGSRYIHTTNFCSNCGADMRPEPPEEE